MTDPQSTSVLDRLAAKAIREGVMDVRRVPIDAIAPNPKQPRRSFTDEATPEERRAANEHVAFLAASIRQIGLQQPIIVHATEDPQRFTIVDGECRWRAHGVAQLPAINAVVLPPDVSPLDVLMRALSANIHRRNLSLREEYTAIVSLRADFQGQDADFASHYGWPPSKLSKMLGLRKLSGIALDAFNEGLLESPETANQFKSLSPTTQQRLLADARSSRVAISRGAVERAMKAAKKPKSAAHGYALGTLAPPLAEALFSALGADLPQPKVARSQLRVLLEARITAAS
ncbi:MAG: ParB/RepB/Spo0J family partition protein [Acidobacteriota bacterium]